MRLLARREYSRQELANKLRSRPAPKPARRSERDAFDADTFADATYEPPSETDVNTLLDDHIGHVDARIAELLHLKQQLGALRQQCQVEQAVDACGILRGLAAMEADTQVERHTHLG